MVGVKGSRLVGPRSRFLLHQSLVTNKDVRKTGLSAKCDRNANYRIGTEFTLSPSLSILGGLAYGKVPGDQSIGSVSVNMISPTPTTTASVGFNWWYTPTHEMQFAYTHHFFRDYDGPSARGDCIRRSPRRCGLDWLGQTLLVDSGITLGAATC